jgi:opacity protein-like surface antigen
LAVGQVACSPTVSMTFHTPRTWIRALAGASFVLALAAPAAAQEQYGGFAKQGGFVSVTFMPGFTFDGETFDGSTWYQKIDGEEIIVLPRLDKQPLTRGILGFRGRNASLELSYERSQHDGTFENASMESTFQAVNADVRYYFATGGRVQPHVLAGGSFPWLRVKHGSFLDGEVGDARWRGYGVNTEVGVTVYPHRQFGVGVGYAYRVIWFDRATGVADEWGELRPRFRETSSNVAITATFAF